MSVLRSLFLAFALIGFFFASGCANAQEPMRLPVDPALLTIVDGEKNIAEFSIEIARTEEQRSAGLMFRIDLPKDRGMLFYFDGEAERFFWMENTPAPLDIIYADSVGQIVHIAKNTTPFSRAPIPSRLPAKFAFEIHAGLADELSIKVGQRLHHPAIEKK